MLLCLAAFTEVDITIVIELKVFTVGEVPVIAVKWLSDTVVAIGLVNL